MLDRIRAFVDQLVAAPGSHAPLEGEEARVAAVALMCHVIAADGVVEEQERDALMAVVAARFGLDAGETEDLIAEAARQDREAVDFYSFTSTLKRVLGREERLSLVGAMWELVYADGGVHEFEDNVIWRVAELLGIDGRERMALKQAASGRGPAGGG